MEINTQSTFEVYFEKVRGRRNRRSRNNRAKSSSGEEKKRKKKERKEEEKEKKNRRSFSKMYRGLGKDEFRQGNSIGPNVNVRCG